jgi:SEC-C motif-containing protein
MELCPCGIGKSYTECCEPYIRGTSPAQTAEELLRSRYTAYVKTEVDYIIGTTIAEKRSQLDKEGVRKWSAGTEWLSLEVLSTEKGGVQDTTGDVEFIAHYKAKGATGKHHEVGKFIKVEGKWYFDDSEFPPQKQFLRLEPKTCRNDPCPCGSGKKFKKCCFGKL